MTEFNGPDWRALGLRLQEARRVLAFTEEKAAEAFGVSIWTYRGYERGKRFRGQGWVAFGRRFDISLDWLLLGTGKMRRD